MLFPSSVFCAGLDAEASSEALASARARQQAAALEAQREFRRQREAAEAAEKERKAAEAAAKAAEAAREAAHRQPGRVTALHSPLIAGRESWISSWLLHCDSCCISDAATASPCHIGHCAPIFLPLCPPLLTLCPPLLTLCHFVIVSLCHCVSCVAVILGWPDAGYSRLPGVGACKAAGVPPEHSGKSCSQAEGGSRGERREGEASRRGSAAAAGSARTQPGGTPHHSSFPPELSLSLCVCVYVCVCVCVGAPLPPFCFFLPMFSVPLSLPSMVVPLSLTHMQTVFHT